MCLPGCGNIGKRLGSCSKNIRLPCSRNARATNDQEVRIELKEV